MLEMEENLSQIDDTTFNGIKLELPIDFFFFLLHLHLICCAQLMIDDDLPFGISSTCKILTFEKKKGKNKQTKWHDMTW